MTHMLPLLDILRDCETDAARAEWLLQVPDGIVLRDCTRIAELLAAASFHLGATFLEIRFSTLNATRSADGDLPPELRAVLEKARSTMRAAVLDVPGGCLQ
ncbi:MAG TPA: hypothetical protein VFY63_08685 [Pseudorhizobium sp.]|nr:hypothetical protein [Pseudorhizobium sp.]